MPNRNFNLPQVNVSRVNMALDGQHFITAIFFSQNQT